MLKNMKELLMDACEENGSTPLQEVIAAISFAGFIPTLWLFLYMLGAR